MAVFKKEQLGKFRDEVKAFYGGSCGKRRDKKGMACDTCSDRQVVACYTCWMPKEHKMRELRVNAEVKKRDEIIADYEKQIEGLKGDIEKIKLARAGGADGTGPGIAAAVYVKEIDAIKKELQAAQAEVEKVVKERDLIVAGKVQPEDVTPAPAVPPEPAGAHSDPAAPAEEEPAPELPDGDPNDPAGGHTAKKRIGCLIDTTNRGR